MKKTSDWLLAAIIGGVLVVCVIAIGLRQSGIWDPFAAMTFAPQNSQTPITGTASPGPSAEGTASAESEAPTTATASPSQTASETDPAESPATAPSPTAAGVDPVESQDPTTATGTPSPNPTETEPVESEEPVKFVGPIAVIVEGDYIVDAVDLGTITEGYTKVYESIFGGSNTVEFVPGDVRVIEATCPDHICISQGWLVADWGSLGDYMPISCLPNSMAIWKLTTDATTAPEVDGATQ